MMVAVYQALLDRLAAPGAYRIGTLGRPVYRYRTRTAAGTSAVHRYTAPRGQHERRGAAPEQTDLCRRTLSIRVMYSAAMHLCVS